MGLNEILKIIQELTDQYLIDRAYIVGGLPRDLHMSIPNIKTTDLDLTTNSSDVLRLGILVADSLNVPFELSEDGHLTVFADEFDLDFSSHFVSDKVVEYLKGKHPGLEEAFSRDFTINTLHQDLATREILDPTHLGFKDIEEKIIRTPVPPEITLTDDPRRAYRAVDLAARYGFGIAPEIKEFVVNNPEMFSAEKIKDKYIAVKINKALKSNEDLTLKLLQEMELFDDVPLSGYFKEVLIKRKMLADYLSKNNLSKTSAFLAKNWKDYVSQGPEYQALKDWWDRNHQSVPGNYPGNYDGWSRWYMDHYRGDWSFQHKDPNQALEVLNQEVSSPNQNSKLKQNIKNFLSTIENPGSTENVRIKPGVNLSNLTPETLRFIEVLGATAQALGAETPIITSGWRSIEEQAAIMAKNWYNNGGAKSGRRYLTKLYGRDYGNDMADIFERYGLSAKGQELAVQVIQKQRVGSSHILSPGQAIDLGLTSGIKKVLEAVQDQKIFDFKIVNETESAGPHYHITVRGLRGRKASVSRKERLEKFNMLIF